MFTGIVEEMGSVLNLEKDESGGGVTLKISCKVVLEGAYLGCSIAVNGVCLTVTEFDERQFTVSHDR
jgi:riboflavin synthase